MNSIHRSRWSRRHVANKTAAAVFIGLSVVAAWPLVSVLWLLLRRGAPRLDFALFTELPPAAGMGGGGIGNALLGSLLVVALAAVWSVPVGTLLGLYLGELAPDGRAAATARRAVKVLAGLPSILAGVFAFAAVVWVTGRFSPLAGGVALGLLMLPIVALTAEEAFRGVPAAAREAALGLGATKGQLVLYTLFPYAAPGLRTGVLLAVSRAAGETAPLLFTLSYSDYWPSGSLTEPTASLAVLIFQFSKSPFAEQQEVGWAAALVLVLAVLSLTLAGRSRK